MYIYNYVFSKSKHRVGKNKSMKPILGAIPRCELEFTARLPVCLTYDSDTPCYGEMMFARQQSRKNSSSCTNANIIDNHSLLSTLPYTYYYRTAAVNLVNIYMYTNEMLSTCKYMLYVHTTTYRETATSHVHVHVHLLSKPGVCIRAQCIHLPSPPLQGTLGTGSPPPLLVRGTVGIGSSSPVRCTVGIWASPRVRGILAVESLSITISLKK